MDISNFNQAIKFAIKREEEAIKSYGKLIAIVKTPGLEKLLHELQAEERNHKKLLQDISREEIETLEIKEVTDLKISDYLIEEPSNAGMNFQDLLILAAKKEQKAVELYSALAEKSEKEELKKLFKFLVQQEKSHKLKLEEEYDKHILEWD